MSGGLTSPTSVVLQHRSLGRLDSHRTITRLSVLSGLSVHRKEERLASVLRHHSGLSPHSNIRNPHPLRSNDEPGLSRPAESTQRKQPMPNLPFHGVPSDAALSSLATIAAIPPSCHERTIPTFASPTTTGRVATVIL